MQKKKNRSFATPQPLFDLVQSQPSPQPPSTLDESFDPPWRVLKNAHEPPQERDIASLPLDLLAQLNVPQRLAVTSTQGPLLLFAGPGSGKTRVITYRIAHLLLNEQVDPRHILALTFTNRAAREMDDRVEQLVGTFKAHNLVISTFHSLCSRLLRHAPETYLLRFALTNTFSIADDLDSLRAVREVIKNMTLAGLDENQQSPAALQSLISHAKNAMITPDQLERQAEEKNNYGQALVARVYRAYDHFLRRGNCLDFDDLLLFANHLLRTEDQVRTRYQQRWHYIHVDEWQDSNLPQYEIIRLLGYGTDHLPTGSRNVCVVGDDDQMIYSWRGASSENLARFESDFHPQTIVLNQNYRSTRRIVEASQDVIRVNADRQEKQLWSNREQGAPISLIAVDSEEQEARFVAQTIQSLRERSILSRWNDAAVLYRTNAQSRAVEEACLHAGIPYTILGNTSFYQRKEIKDLLAYLRLLSNPDDDLSLLRIVNTPPRGIGTQTLEKLQEWAQARSLSLSGALDRLHECPQLSNAAKGRLTLFAHLMITIRASLDELTLPDLLDQVVRVSGFEAMLKQGKDGQRERWENVEELKRVVAQFASLETRHALELCLEHVALMSGSDMMQQDENDQMTESDEPRDAVTLLTLHSAKGLEFRACFLIGMEENLLPHSRVLMEEGNEGIAEERRLCYVGLTRAMDHLYLVRSSHRELFGRTVASKPSRFLDALSAHAV